MEECIWILFKSKQKKTITFGIIDPTVLQFLRRDFLQKTNASVFNKKIKELCRLAGIDQVIKGNKMSSVTKRLAFGMYQKYELLTSQTMRRSFATNYFLQWCFWFYYGPSRHEN